MLMHFSSYYIIFVKFFDSLVGNKKNVLKNGLLQP